MKSRRTPKRRKNNGLRAPSDVSRRDFLKLGAAGLGAAGAVGLSGGLLAACDDKKEEAKPAESTPGTSTAPIASGSAPETPDIRFGMIALTDCSPIVIAHEKGMFKKYGINSTVIKGASWAAIRDSLSNGDIQATHMLLGMPIASTMGLLGSPQVPMIVPWLINRNGQAITVKAELKGKVATDPKVLKPLVEAAKKAGSPMTFAMTFPPGTHAMWMRYYLAAGGINPDKDVALVTVPPSQMVANMKIGKMDGFCVGEPWGARSIADGIGYTAITTQEIWKDHPEKVCAFKEDFAQKNPKTVKAILKALHEASVWLDDLKNRPEQAAIVSRPTYINCPPEIILGRLQGHYDYGDGRKTEDPNYMIFSSRNCNYPQPKYLKWWLSQFRRWGMVPQAPDYEGIAKRVMRGDIYEEAMKELGVTHAGMNNDPETLFDGVTFNPGEPEAYAKAFAVHSLTA
jgi:nitrate/nitrite transport system substrate-binding protein